MNAIRKIQVLSQLLVILVALTGCTFHLGISDLNSKAGLASVSVPSFENSLIKVIPAVSSIPIDGEVKVQYCIRDSVGNLIEKSDYSVVFELKAGATGGSFSPTTYNQVDKCYESTFKGESVGSRVDF
ncbi:MAG: hypothetical protein JNL11_04230 [Bdellovibrionaceae bacterium]|nr:hypothetical protein [Pseudobdellovibrionaceae bacterium]